MLLQHRSTRADNPREDVLSDVFLEFQRSIGVGGGDSPEEGDDGEVRMTSQHLDVSEGTTR